MLNTYLSDILDQPQALRFALQNSDFTAIEPLRKAIIERRIERIILTGMGASYYGLYPAWLHLVGAGLSAIWVDSAELFHHAPALLDEKTLLWVASQSGRSAEVVNLLQLLQNRSIAGMLALTNDLKSPLGRAALARGGGYISAVLPLFAVPEHVPSTRTYLNTLAIGQLAALELVPSSDGTSGLAAHHAALERTAEAINTYLEDWDGAIQRIAETLANLPTSHRANPQMVLLGRGPSLTTAFAGALCLQEAAKISALGMQSGEFRHGPLEIAAKELTVWIFDGESGILASELNRKLWNELRQIGVNAWLLGVSQQQTPVGGQLSIPAADGIGIPLAEIIPVQLLSYHIAQEAGFEPGTFRHIGKITQTE